MSYKIDPDAYCIADGCSRPKAAGEVFCPTCLVHVAGPEAGTTSGPEAKLPRCVAYLSQAGDVITLELTGEPRFTEADVELVAAALSNRRRAA